MQCHLKQLSDLVNRRFLLPTKSNISENKNGFAFSIQSYWLENSQISTSKVVWETEMVTEDVLNLMKTSDDPEEQSALQEAIVFLSDLLKDCPMSIKKIKTFISSIRALLDNSQACKRTIRHHT